MNKDLSKELIAETLRDIPIHDWASKFYKRKEDDQFESKGVDESDDLDNFFELNPTLGGFREEVRQY